MIDANKMQVSTNSQSDKTFVLVQLQCMLLTTPNSVKPLANPLGGGFGFSPEFGCFENRLFYFRARAFFSYEEKKLVTFSIKNFYRYIGSTLHNDIIYRIIFYKIIF